MTVRNSENCGYSLETYVCAAVEKGTGKWEDSEDNIEAAVVDEYDGALVRRTAKPLQPDVEVIDQPRPG